MLHEFLSAVTDELLSYTEAETEEDIKCEDIVTVVTNKLNSCGVDTDKGGRRAEISIVSLLLYRIITKNMRIPSFGKAKLKRYDKSIVEFILDDPNWYIEDVSNLCSMLYNKWSKLPLDSQDVKLLKKYFYPKESVERQSKFSSPYDYNYTLYMSDFYIGALGIDREYDFDAEGADNMASIICKDIRDGVDDTGVLTLDLNRPLFTMSIWYKSLIFNVKMKDFAKAIWREVLSQFAVSNLTDIKITPYAINAEGATRKTMEDNFSIEMAGQSYTISEFIDALTSEFAKILKSSKAAVIANKRNLTQSKTLR